MSEPYDSPPMTAPTPTTAAEAQLNRWRDTLTGEGVDTILSRAWDCYVHDNTSALDARYAARDARSVALYLRAALLAARRENEELKQLLYEHVQHRSEEAATLRNAFCIPPDMRDLATQLLEVAKRYRAALAATPEEK